MGDMGDDFRAMKEMAKDEKEARMKKNLDYLNSIGIYYEPFNSGYQLNFFTPLGTISFYPSTNKWVLDSEVFRGSADNFLNWLARKLGFFNWVKRLGQWHIAEKDSSKTLCGCPMLGNNYSKHIPIHARDKCVRCWGKII